MKSSRFAHPQGPSPLRRQYLAGGGGAGPEPCGALSSHRKIWHYEKTAAAAPRSAIRRAWLYCLLMALPTFLFAGILMYQAQITIAPTMAYRLLSFALSFADRRRPGREPDPADADAFERGGVSARGRLFLPRPRRLSPGSAWESLLGKSMLSPICCRSSGCARWRRRPCWLAFLRSWSRRCLPLTARTCCSL